MDCCICILAVNYSNAMYHIISNLSEAHLNTFQPKTGNLHVPPLAVQAHDKLDTALAIYLPMASHDRSPWPSPSILSTWWPPIALLSHFNHCYPSAHTPPWPGTAPPSSPCSLCTWWSSTTLQSSSQPLSFQNCPTPPQKRRTCLYHPKHCRFFMTPSPHPSMTIGHFSPPVEPVHDDNPQPPVPTPPKQVLVDHHHPDSGSWWLSGDALGGPGGRHYRLQGGQGQEHEAWRQLRMEK